MFKLLITSSSYLI